MSKCRLKMYRPRIMKHHDGSGGLLVFYCINPDHDHGPYHSILQKLTADSIVVDPDDLYPTMVK